MRDLSEFNPRLPIGSYTGPIYLLRWWCSQTQYSVTVARTFESLLTTFRAVRRHDDHMTWENVSIVEPKELWQGSIVMPPDDYIAAYQRDALRAAIDSFRCWVLCLTDGIEEDQLATPFQLIPCPGYEAAEDESPDDWMKERHFGCQRCKENRFLLSLEPEKNAAAWEDLFWRGRGLWKQTEDRRNKGAGVVTRPAPWRRPVAGQRARVGFPLMLWTVSEGHHAPGVEYGEYVEPGDLLSMQAPPLFFFQGRQIDLPIELTAEIEAEHETARLGKVRARETGDDREKRERAERHVLLTRVLNAK